MHLKHLVVGVSTAALIFVGVPFLVSAKEGDSSTSNYPTIGGTDTARKIQLQTARKIENIDNIAEFRKKKLKEIEDKIKEVQAKRKECRQTENAALKKRNAERLEMAKKCKLEKPDPMPTTAAERKAAMEEATKKLKACREQVTQFQKETTEQIKSLRATCANTERAVLGLNTIVASDY